ncbi:hypothetical protein F4778DRAFT_798137 [Xylariomycetidae sp. FL2044]|nr:hypothetical protein F4778DRAFT_798137 [Xylariomycetidae sp. FL2044]
MGVFERVRTARVPRQARDGQEYSSIPSLPPPSSARQRHPWSDTWLWELSAIMFSCACFIASLVLLAQYNQKPIPRFSYGITLNALVSVFMTFSKSALLVAVAGAMSQLKWRWYQISEGGGRPLLDTQLFDDASRGPWGSLVLLFTPHSWSLVCLGAVVTILALAFDPFAQQLVHYPTRLITTPDPKLQTPSVPYAKTFAPGHAVMMGDLYPEIRAVDSIVSSALWDLSGDDDGRPSAQCSTGNCTWAEFDSLAICSTCQNVTTSEIGLPDCSLNWNRSEVEQAIEQTRHTQSYVHVEKNCSLQLPPNFPCKGFPDLHIVGDIEKSASGSYYYPFSLTYPAHIFASSTDHEPFMVQNEGGHIHIPEDPNLQSTPLAILPFCSIGIERENDILSIKQATTCQLNPCVRRYSFSITNGLSSFKILNSRYGAWYFDATGLSIINDQLVNTETGTADGFYGLKPSWSDAPASYGLLRNLSNSTSSPRPAPELFTISADAIDLLRLIELRFTGEALLFDTSANVEENSIAKSSSIHFQDQFQTKEGLYLVPEEDSKVHDLLAINDHGGLSLVVPRLAAKLSKYIRERDGIPVPGQSYAPVSFVQVQWPWVTLPAVTWGLGVGFLLVTMWICRGDDQVLWRTSSLPLVYHGLDAEEIRNATYGAGGIEKVSMMETLSKEVRVKLRRSPVDRQLKLTRGAQPTEIPNANGA